MSDDAAPTLAPAERRTEQPAEQAETVAPEPSVAPPSDDVAWRRFHPVTPVVRGWKVVAAILAVLAYRVADDIEVVQEIQESVGWGPVVLAILAVAAVGFVYAYLSWRMARFAIGDEAVHLRTGVLFRQQRQARLDRLQAVDVVRPLLARVVGLAQLNLEVAGGADSSVALAFLKEDEALALRAELLARAAGIEPTQDGGPEPEAPERPVYEVTTSRLVGSLVRSGSTVLLGVILVGGIAALAVALSMQSPDAVVDAGLGAAAAMGLGGIVPMAFAVIGFFGQYWKTYTGMHGFTASVAGDGVRVRRGLLETRSQTVPPGRVQSITFHQPRLWRSKDWWKVTIAVAGRAGSEDDDTADVLLPVGTRDEALTALWLVLPDLVEGEPRARLEAALSGEGTAEGFTLVSERMRRFDPLVWRRAGFCVTERALLVRTGRLGRHLEVVPHERSQSLGLAAGPIDRRKGVADLVVHLTEGTVTLQHVDSQVAAAWLTDQSERARVARSQDRSERWMAPAVDEAP